MGSWSTESTGIKAMKPIADERLARGGQLSRVWNNERESWGFYAKDPSEEDEFIVWTSIVPGDRLLIRELQCTVVASHREIESGVAKLKFKLLDSGGTVFDISVGEKELFRIARKYI